MIKLSDWFNINNIKHIKALKCKQKNEKWPDNFIPNNVELDHNWEMKIALYMADAWIENALQGNINTIYNLNKITEK